MTAPVGRRPPRPDPAGAPNNGPYPCPDQVDGWHSYRTLTFVATGVQRTCSCGATWYRDDGRRRMGFFWEWVVEE